MRHGKQQLRVIYDGLGDGPHIDKELDKVLEEVLSRQGFKRWASGCDMVPPFERDLAFERPSPIGPSLGEAREEVHHPVPAEP